MTDIAIAVIIVLIAGVVVLATAVMRAVWIIPQARARNVERPAATTAPSNPASASSSRSWTA